MYNKKITYRDAMELYNISETCAHKYMTDYKTSQGIPVMPQSTSGPSIQYASAGMETYISMSKEELIKAKAYELWAKRIRSETSSCKQGVHSCKQQEFEIVMELSAQFSITHLCDVLD